MSNWNWRRAWLFAPLLPNPRSQSCSWITEEGALTTQLQQTRAWQNSGTPPDTPDSVRCDLGGAGSGCRAQRRWWVRVSGTEPGFRGVPYLQPFTPGERAASWSGGNVLDTSDTAQRLEHSLEDQLVIRLLLFSLCTLGAEITAPTRRVGRESGLQAPGAGGIKRPFSPSTGFGGPGDLRGARPQPRRDAGGARLLPGSWGAGAGGQKAKMCLSCRLRSSEGSAGPHGLKALAAGPGHLCVLLPCPGSTPAPA